MCLSDSDSDSYSSSSSYFDDDYKIYIRHVNEKGIYFLKKLSY